MLMIAYMGGGGAGGGSGRTISVISDANITHASTSGLRSFQVLTTLSTSSVLDCFLHSRCTGHPGMCTVCTSSHMAHDQGWPETYIYGVYTVYLAGNSLKIRSYTVYICTVLDNPTHD